MEPVSYTHLAVYKRQQPKIKVRLIDCVGFMVEGASGHMEGNESRMVKTPWSEQEIPFTTAASIGTQKVIRDHATIGIVVTTDGTIGELPRNAYVKAEEQTVEELNAIAKPYVILLNSQKPYSDETVSYTHLDVYKRQISGKWTGRTCKLERLLL